VTIAGAAPTSGQILVGTGKPVAGKVISSAPVTGGNDVTLEILPLDKVFADLRIGESYDSKKLVMEFPVGPPSATTVNADGSITRQFVLDLPAHKPTSAAMYPDDTLAWVPRWSKSFRLGPMYCGAEATVEPSISASQITYAVTPTLGPVQYELGVGLTGVFLRVVADGIIQAKASGPLRLNGELAGTIGCQAPVIQLLAPVPPPVALIAIPALVIGPRFGASGKLTINVLELVIDAAVKQPFTLGFEAQAVGTFTNLSALPAPLEYKIDPKLRNTTPDSPGRVQYEARGGLYAEAALTSIPYYLIQQFKGEYPFLSMLDLEAGMSGEFRWATIADQINDPNFNAGYDIKIQTQLGLGGDLKTAFGWLSDAAMWVPVDPSLKFEKTVFESPTGMVLSYLGKYQAGERVDFRALLPLENATPPLLDYFNVKSVEVWRKNGAGGATKVARRDATSLQIDMDHDVVDVPLNWIADHTGVSGNQDGTYANGMTGFVEPVFGEGYFFKFSPTYAWSGIQQLGAGNDEIGRALVTDGEGRVIVTGFWLDNFAGRPFFGGADAGWLEFSANGVVSNAILTGTAGDDVPTDIAVGPDGFAYVAGTTLGSAFKGTQAFSAWLKKIDRAGEVVWTKEWITPGYDLERAFKLAIGPGNAIYVGSTASIGAVLTGGAVLATCGNGYHFFPENSDPRDCGDVVLSAFDTDGNVMWSKADPRRGYQAMPGVAVDSSGNIVVAATSWGDIGMDKAPGNVDSMKPMSDPNYAKCGIGIWTYDSSGNRINRRFLHIPENTTLGTPPANVALQAVTADSMDNVTLIGNAEGPLLAQPFVGGQDAFLIQYSMAALMSGGPENWAKLVGTAGQELGIGVRALPNGDLLVSGLTWGSLFAPSAGSADAFVMWLSSSGAPLWPSVQFGGPGNDIGTDVAMDRYGNTFVSGETDDRLGDSLTAGFGRRDMFVAKFGPSGVRQ
jgi:hypothetical protein